MPNKIVQIAPTTDSGSNIALLSMKMSMAGIIYFGEETRIIKVMIYEKVIAIVLCKNDKHIAKSRNNNE